MPNWFGATINGLEQDTMKWETLYERAYNLSVETKTPAIIEAIIAWRPLTKELFAEVCSQSAALQGNVLNLTAIDEGLPLTHALDSQYNIIGYQVYCARRIESGLIVNTSLISENVTLEEARKIDIDRAYKSKETGLKMVFATPEDARKYYTELTTIGQMER